MGRQRIRKTKKGIIATREGAFSFIMYLCCFTFVLQVKCFALFRMLICITDLCVNLFGEIVEREGTVLFTCFFSVCPFLTWFFVRA